MPGGDSSPPGENTKKEKANEYHSYYYLGSIIVGCPARLAVQPQLGLQWKWHCWFLASSGRTWLTVWLVLAMSRKWILALVCAVLVLSACSANQSNAPATQANPELENVLPPDVALNVQNQISETLGVAVENIQIENVEKMDWPNSCLGLPEGDEVCAEAITPGWLLTFNINNQEYRYRVDETGTVIRQEP